MSLHHESGQRAMTLVRLEDFDTQSGSWVERLLFNNRFWIVMFCGLITLLLGWQMTKLQLNASFEKTIPIHHPYIEHFTAHQKDLSRLGNAVRVIVADRKGTIYNKDYLEALRQINDELFVLPGVNRVQMKSLWTPSTRWTGVTEEGLEGGPVVPDNYDGTPASLQQLSQNVARSGEVGQLVATDAKSTLVYLPLLAQVDGRPLDYGRLSKALEDLRAKYQAQGVDVHIVGFAKVVGDLIEGVRDVLLFFAVAMFIATMMVFWYTRCARSTALVVSASVVAVIWQLGLLPALGYSLDPYSILVPFLVFAIGMSHGAQKMNGIMQDIGRGEHKLVAARYTFRRLFLAGLTALLADAIGFAVLLVIDIQAIRELAIAASIGVAMLVVTNLILLPILLSYTGVSPKAAARSLRADEAAANGQGQRMWGVLARFTTGRWAWSALALSVLLGAAGFVVNQRLQIGDLDRGAPELRAYSRYNRDVAFMNQAYGASSDVLAVMVTTPEGQCARFDTLNRIDALEWELQKLEGVETTNTLSKLIRFTMMGLAESNPRWYEFVPNQDMLNTVAGSAPRGFFNESCSLLTVYAYLRDHKADTLKRVVERVESFASANDTKDVHFLLAAGNAGIEAATNVVVTDAWRKMLFLVYGAVVLLCFVTFRNWRAVVVAVLPLVLTSVLAETLMVLFGIGVKVATLPVIALGVGIGVDYALYILSAMLANLRQGQSLIEAYLRALRFTGKVVMLTGFTLAVGVVTWAASPIKFQADMGLLLAFMFLWNMLGALILLPALAYFFFPTSREGRPATAEGLVPAPTL